MKTPLERPNPDKMTRHHLLFEKPEWNSHHQSKTVRELGAYVVGVRRAPHDYLHGIIKPVYVPHIAVLSMMHDLGKQNSGIQNDQTKTDNIVEEMFHFARTTYSPEQAHDALHVATSIEAQMSIIAITKNITARNK